MRENNLANAELENDYVVNAEIPELNTAVINDIEIEYQESGDDATVIANNFTTLLNIAQQCPYSGGHAVMRARVLLSMLTDSIAYDDDGNCLQSGIYRKSKDAAAEVKTTEGIQIIPNPANDKIEIKLNGINDGICRVQIKNMLNEIVFDDVWFEEEYKAIRNIGGVFVLVERTGFDQPNWEFLPDFKICNDGTINNFEKKVCDLVQKVL